MRKFYIRDYACYSQSLLLILIPLEMFKLPVKWLFLEFDWQTLKVLEDVHVYNVILNAFAKLH